MLDIQEIQKHWIPLSDVLISPTNEEEYRRLIKTLDQLIDHVGCDGHHPLASLMGVMGVIIENYEDNYKF